MIAKSGKFRLFLAAAVLSWPLAAWGVAAGSTSTTQQTQDGEGYVVPTGGGGGDDPPIIVHPVNNWGGVLEPARDPNTGGGGGGNPQPDDRLTNADMGTRTLSFSGPVDDGGTSGNDDTVNPNNDDLTNSPSDPVGGDTPIDGNSTSGGNLQPGSGTVEAAIAERRPDFRYDEPMRLFMEETSFGSGQKRMGVSPGPASAGPRFVPIGEF